MEDVRPKIYHGKFFKWKFMEDFSAEFNVLNWFLLAKFIGGLWSQNLYGQI